MTPPDYKDEAVPPTLFTSYCPKHKRQGRDQTGFRCICAELELSYLSGRTDYRIKSEANLDGVNMSEAVKMGCEGLLGPTVKIFATALTQADALGYARGREEAFREAADEADLGFYDIGATATEATGVVRKTRDEIAQRLRARALTEEPAKPCGCGNPSRAGTRHRTDGPCYHSEEP